MLATHATKKNAPGTTKAVTKALSHTKQDCTEQALKKAIGIGATQIAALQVHFLGYTDRKPRGPVLQNTKSEEVAAPTVKRGFVTPNFWGLVRQHLPYMVKGEMAHSARMGARLRTCFEHLTHLMRFKTQMVVLLYPEGAKTMTAMTLAGHCAVPAKPKAIPADHLQTVLGAFNAANLASSYIERGNFAAARRKLVLALQAINQLQAEV
ncbi:hypothetical protein HNP33_003497 [Comamonas odontotermitis]|uniref:Uncharacterized protein n=1 Tax=Comamonas odontotermitis TaxID=379895 RepID=A0ABR6RJN0_9BURK|nr:hypothetical protein [Comamonas odontotermitis]MBB6579385.1 hypothetical protein [Comamonas odontotermitis]